MIFPDFNVRNKLRKIETIFVMCDLQTGSIISIVLDLLVHWLHSWMKNEFLVVEMTSNCL